MKKKRIKGKNIGLYNSWEKCTNQINGYSGAEYNKVQGKIAALKYINPNLVMKKDKKTSAKHKNNVGVK